MRQLEIFPNHPGAEPITPKQWAIDINHLIRSGAKGLQQGDRCSFGAITFVFGGAFDPVTIAVRDDVNWQEAPRIPDGATVIQTSTVRRNEFLNALGRFNRSKDGSYLVVENPHSRQATYFWKIDHRVHYTYIVRPITSS